MPDQELEHTADADLPGAGERVAPPAGDSGAADLQDLDLRQEIELVADLVVAASASDGPLSTAEIDRILGVRRG